MREVRTKYNPKFHSNTFLELQRSSHDFVIGQKYYLIDYSNRTMFLNAYLTEKQTILRSELTNIITLLNNDVDVQMHNKCDALYQSISPNDLIDVLIFRTIYTYVKPYEKLPNNNL